MLLPPSKPARVESPDFPLAQESATRGMISYPRWNAFRGNILKEQLPLLRMKRPFPSSFEDIVDTAQRICDAHGLVPSAKATIRLAGHRPHVEEVSRKPRQQGEVVHCVLPIWTTATCRRREPQRSDKAACLPSQKYRGPGELGRSIGLPPSAQLGGRSPGTSLRFSFS